MDSFFITIPVENVKAHTLIVCAWIRARTSGCARCNLVHRMPYLLLWWCHCLCRVLSLKWMKFGSSSIQCYYLDSRICHSASLNIHFLTFIVSALFAICLALFSSQLPFPAPYSYLIHFHVNISFLSFKLIYFEDSTCEWEYRLGWISLT